jgi:hypothetical protein
MLASGAAVAASQAVVDNEASEYVNRTGLSKKSIQEVLINEEKFDKRFVEIALKKAEKEWGGPTIWNDKAKVSAEIALDEKKLSCEELMVKLLDWHKFTFEQAQYAAKAVNVCK